MSWTMITIVICLIFIFFAFVYIAILRSVIKKLDESESKWRNEATRLNNELAVSRKTELMLRNRFKIN